MKLQNIVCCSAAAVALAGTGWAQTRVDLRTQSKSIDFSAASSTSPSQIGIQLPATCQVGATFVLTSAAAGQNWFLCTSANLWTVQGNTLPAVTGNANTVLSTNGVALIWQTLAGDIGGAPGSVSVNKLLGRPLSVTAPTSGQFLGWNGTQWTAQTIATASSPITSVFGRTGVVVSTTGDYSFSQIAGSVTSGQLPVTGGDLSGAITSATVAKIQGQAVATVTPLTGQVLTWSGTRWTAQNASGGVPSVFGRSGAVTAQTGDYTAAQVTSAANTATTNSYLAGARQSFQGSVGSAGIQIVPGPLPTIASAGDLAVDSASSNQLKIYSGSAWVALNPNVTFPPGNYTTSFTAQTSISVPGATHGLGTPNLLVQCYDNATPANVVEPSLISVDPNNFAVTVTFATAETGRCVLNGYNGGSGSSGGSQVLAGASMAAQLGDFAVVITSPSTLSIGSNCSPSTPCNVRFGAQTYSITAAAGVTLNGGSGLEYIYVDTTGLLTAGSTLSATCGGSCVVNPNVTGFPINSIPLYTWSASNGSWDTTGGVDRRGWLSSNPLLGGPGIATVAAGGLTTVSVDSAVVPTFLTGSATLAFPSIAAGTCSADLTFSLLGANPGDGIATGWPSALAAGLSGTMRVSAADTVSVRLCADTTGAVTPASATFTATVVRSF